LAGAPYFYRRLLALGLFALGAPSALGAQNTVPDPGEEVRVVQRGERGAVHGLFVEATAQHIVLRSLRGGGPIRISRADITGMSVQRGHRSNALKGALVGIGVGVVTGIILGQTSGSVDNTGVAVGISVGAALPLGLLVGWLIRSPEWDGIDMVDMAPRPFPVGR